MFRKLSIALLSAMILPVNAHADDDSQTWGALAISGPAKEDSKLLLWFDGHARTKSDSGEIGTSIIRPGIGWRYNDRVDLWVGVARVTSHNSTSNIEENRIWQQATYGITEALGGKISGRTRIEQRFRRDADDTGHRVRQFFRWSKPLSREDWSIVAWDEVFIAVNDTDWGQSDGYQQNRAFIGLGYQAAPKARLEFGYLNNHLNRPIGEGQVNHNISVALSLGL